MPQRKDLCAFRIRYSDGPQRGTTESPGRTSKTIADNTVVTGRKSTLRRWLLLLFAQPDRDMAPAIRFNNRYRRRESVGQDLFPDDGFRRPVHDDPSAAEQ